VSVFACAIAAAPKSNVSPRAAYFLMFGLGNQREMPEKINDLSGLERNLTKLRFHEVSAFRLRGQKKQSTEMQTTSGRRRPFGALNAGRLPTRSQGLARALLSDERLRKRYGKQCTEPRCASRV
jgi:hypothetical protein